MATERWQSIPGYEGHYEASSSGLVRSVGHITRVSRANNRAYERRNPERVLRPGLSKGYETVNLHKGGQRASFHVAHLVALAFIGPRPDGMYVCHRDGCRRNNAASNLYYGTPVANVEDMRRHGTMAQGSRSPHAKLTEWDVLAIRRRDAALGPRELARRYGVDCSTISRILSGQRWKHVA